MKRILIISLTLVLIVSLGFIFLSKYPLSNYNNASVNDSTLAKDLEGNNAKELNYLFFPTSENGTDPSDKLITLFFTKSVVAYKFSKVELLQNGSSVSNKVKISANDTKDNKVQISLSEFVPEFNQTKFTMASGKTITLNVGQFYLEKISYPFDIDKDDQCSLKTSNTTELGNSFQGSYTLSSKDKYKLIMLSPKKASETGFTQNTKETTQAGEDIAYQYSCSVPLDYFKNHDIKDISFDIAWIQESLKDGKQYRVITCNIPLVDQPGN